MTSKPVSTLLMVIALLMGLLVLYAAAQEPLVPGTRQVMEYSPVGVELAGINPASPAATDATIAPVQPGIACAPATLVYEVEVRNDDIVPDTIDISALAENFWPVAVEPASLTLEPGMSGMVDVTVEIPWHAEAGDTQSLVITADPQLGDPVTGTVQTTAALAAGWQDLAASPHGTTGLAVVYEGGYLYQAGGYDSGGHHAGTYRYDLTGNTWETLSGMITATAHMDGAAIGGNIYVPGGETAESNWNGFVQVYSTTADIWDTVAPMPVPVRSHEVVARSGRLYVLGGQTTDGVYTDTVQIYYPATDSWSEGSPMPIPVAYAASGVIGGKIYLAGGYNGSYQAALQIYDPASNSWSVGQALPSPWAQAADGVVHNRYLILAGGSGGPLDTGSASAWFYDAANDAWYPLPDANSFRYGAEGNGDGSEFYYLGGLEGDGVGSPSGRHEHLVQCAAPAPQARVEATALDATTCPGGAETASFEVCNDGNAPLQFNVEEISAAADLIAPQSPTAVLLDQPLEPGFPDGLTSQDFEPVRDADDIFIADDFSNDQWWAISTIFVPGLTALPQGDLQCAAELHWEIYADDGGVPAGNPRGAPPVWAYYGTTSDPNLVFTSYLSFDRHVRLNLDVPITLPPGHWWLVFYPSLSSSDCFRYARLPSTTTNGAPAQVINPGQGLGLPDTWTSVLDESIPGLGNHDFAFQLGGVTLGDVEWLSEDPPTGALEGGQCTTVDVLFDATGVLPGAYDAELAVGSSDPSTSSSNLPVSLVVHAPAEILDVSYVVDERQVAFDATATGTEPLGFYWAFGDGNTSSLEDPVHDYGVYQCYQVALTVDNVCDEDVWATKLCLARPTVYLPVVGKNP